MIIENIEQGIHYSITNQQSDFTAESIASSLIKKGVLPEQIIFKSEGTAKRSYKKDVSSIYTSPIEESDSHLLFIESPREGIYDTLPESIFHSFSGYTSPKNIEEIKERIKKNRKEEKDARLFFLPFEQEFFNIKRTLFTIEDQFECFSNASSLIDMYSNFYPILNDLSIEKAYLFLRLSPVIHDIRDDFNKVEACLAMLVDIDVKISIQIEKNMGLDHALPTLGDSTLGANLILGDHIEDGEPDLLIQITPKDVRTEHDYSFFKNKISLTYKLCDYFIGAHYNISIVCTGAYQHTSFSNRSILGYNVYL